MFAHILHAEYDGNERVRVTRLELHALIGKS